MKKVISFLLTVIIILSSVTVVSAENESAYSSTASNFISFLKRENADYLIKGNNYFYMQLISENKSSATIQYCTQMIDLLIESGAKPDKQKYREALINIITVHDLDSANSISEQKKLDNLKGLKDYSMDIVSIATDYISLSSFKNPETQKIKDNISTAMGALNVLSENTNNWIEAFSDLETVIQNYAYYDEFLKLVEEKSEDKDLSDAAKDLKTSLTRAMEIKLETYSDVSSENFENYTEYFFTDALFTVAKQVPEYENDETFKSFIDSSSNIVGTVKDSWNLGVSIGTLVGNFVVGGENLINRVFEMEAIYNISVILKDELLDSKYLSSINTENETDYISRYVTFSEFLISSRIRGEYCFLSVMTEDAGLLNNFYKSTAEEAKKKYDIQVQALLSTRELLLGIVTVDEDESKTDDTEIDDTVNTNDTISVFASMPEAFTFSSGAGGWATSINIEDDGTFIGRFSDGNYDIDGSYFVDICNFSGKFSTPKKVDEYTYSMKLSSLELERTPGEIYYEDDIKYICSEPYGFDDADEFLIYLPDTPIGNLPQGIFSYINRNRETLPSGYYALYNKGSEDVFIGSFEDAIWKHEYIYNFKGKTSKLQPSCWAKSFLTFRDEKESVASINLAFDWVNNHQTQFTVDDIKGSGSYTIKLNISEDKSTVKVSVESATGKDLSPWGGTTDGKLEAEYQLNNDE